MCLLSCFRVRFLFVMCALRTALHTHTHTRIAISIYSWIIKCHRGSSQSTARTQIDWLRKIHIEVEKVPTASWQLNELRINLNKLFIIIFKLWFHCESYSCSVLLYIYYYYYLRSCKLHNCCHFLSCCVVAAAAAAAIAVLTEAAAATAKRIHSKWNVAKSDMQTISCASAIITD